MPPRMSIGLWREPVAHLLYSGCILPHASGPPLPA
jgi:hypothetical protein